MRVIQLFLSFLFLSVLAGIWAILSQQSPEDLLLGEWKEADWQFEKVNHNGQFTNLNISEMQKEEICKSMIIHESEGWRFTSNHSLELQNDNQKGETLTWNVKGRGNILELKHRNKSVEDFQIQSLTNDSLVIHFNFDLQIRGIVKMTFRRETETLYAQQVQ